MKVSKPSGLKLSLGEAQRRVAEQWWGFDFELLPGMFTGGGFAMHPPSACDALSIPADLTGKRVLDVGAWDGPVTFELERRGGQVAALDIQDPTRVGFDLARTILQSQAVHYQASVYQLPFAPLQDLDLIVFRGVYYHLKYPILAFERLSAALRLGGTLHFEGEGLINYIENSSGQPVDFDVAALNATNAPICLAYPNSYRGGSNWFIPNQACLEGWLNVAGFEVRAMEVWEEAGQRLYGWAVKVREPETVEHVQY